MLEKALRKSIAGTYNCVSVDGDTSTNDSCLLLANGCAGNEIIDSEGEDFDKFRKALKALTINLARQMAADGEGAHALFEVTVKGASSRDQAVKLSKSVISSSLVKTAIAGHDANWGRIICAMGYSGAVFDVNKTDLTFKSAAGELQIARGGVTTGFSEELATKILSEKEITAVIDIHEGDKEATAWGCDLTHEYININADYRS
jgi:glutamate N-acetyltransferase/amino-acid N-acetyltransferase